MLRRLLKSLMFLFVIVCILAGIVFYGAFVSVERVNITYKTIESSKIPKELDNIKIAFLSDIHYNQYMNKDRFSTMVEKLNNAHPDVVIFGGDLFDHASVNAPTIEIQNELKELMRSIKAPLGKFAVLGEGDLENDTIKVMVSNILYDSDFELITNQNIRIRNQSTQSISLVGIDSLILGTPDVEAAFSNVSNQDFVIAVSHAPDIVKQLPIDNISLFLAGHSHGGQISIPLYGPLQKIDGAREYSQGVYQLKEAIIDVSNGVGTTDYDIRLFAPPEILIYRLSAK